MTEKRFRVNDLVKYNYSEIGEYIDENHTDRPVRNDEVVELLNELHEENTMLKERRHEDINDLSVIAMRYKALEKENERLKQFKSKFYDMIDKRIRVLEHDYNQAVKNGIPSNSVYSEIELLEELKEEMDHI